MNKSKNTNLQLKIGHLFLAIWLSTVPTLITYGVLSFHGLNICRNLGKTYEEEKSLFIKSSCDEEAWATTKSYIFLIGFFITLPTWMWFYLSVKSKKNV